MGLGPCMEIKSERKVWKKKWLEKQQMWVCIIKRRAILGRWVNAPKYVNLNLYILFLFLSQVEELETH